jgi:hypothetical protein
MGPPSYFQRMNGTLQRRRCLFAFSHCGEPFPRFETRKKRGKQESAMGSPAGGDVLGEAERNHRKEIVAFEIHEKQ